MRNFLFVVPLTVMLTACTGSPATQTTTTPTAPNASTTSSSPAVQAMVDFGQCLKDKGAVFYGTDWCPHCKAQRATLGDALATVTEVDCDAQKALCAKKKITGYPTWVLADDTRLIGSQSLEQLSAATDCEAPATDTPAAPAA